VFDVAPTILALLGLPVSAELEGVVLESLFAPGALPPRARIARYDIAPGMPPVEATPYDDQAEERLRALGYVE
jgi:arylsulfatase A-like enzyme